MRSALLLTGVRLGILRVRVGDAMSSMGLGQTANASSNTRMHVQSVRAYSPSIHFCSKPAFEQFLARGPGCMGGSGHPLGRADCQTVGRRAMQGRLLFFKSNTGFMTRPGAISLHAMSATRSCSE